MQGFYVSGVLRARGFGQALGGLWASICYSGGGGRAFVSHRGIQLPGVYGGRGGCTASRVLKVRFQFQWNSHTEMLQKTLRHPELVIGVY